MDTSLQTGVLDGFEHTASTVLSFKFYEIAKYTTLTRHPLDPTVVAFSLSEWNTLDDQEQATVMEASKLATDLLRAMAPIRDAESLEALRSHGMVINEIDMSEARAQAADVQRGVAAELQAEDLLQQVLSE